MKHIKFITFFVLHVFAMHLNAQITKIMGTCIDATTREPLPFVNIALKGTTIGTTTNFKGEFSIETKSFSDSLLASFVGYLPQTFPITKGKFQTINFELQSNNIQLNEVVITYKGNPAEKLLKKVIENKEKNNFKKYDALQYEAYSKIQFDANNISDKFKQRRVFKQFQFIWDFMDTSIVNGKAYLPVFLSESLSDIYISNSPKSKKEVIKASKISGIENESISQFLGDMYQEANIYDNYITLFDKNFVSPIANFGTMYYRYYLIDSSYIDNQWCYHLSFKPRRKQELTFTGNFWVHDTTFAIKKFDMEIADDANINWINALVIRQDFQYIDSAWFKTNEKITADFNLLENTKSTMGFYGTRSTSYKNFVMNKPMQRDFYATPTDIIVKDDAYKKDDGFWNSARHDSLDKKEQSVYKMIDSVKKVPVFRTYVDVVIMATTGYYVWDKYKIELGPYMSTYSFNEFEGNRFRFGGRTANSFSTKVMFNAHIAYGTKDERFKYGAGLIYMFNKNPRRAFGASYKYDVEQLGKSENAFRDDYLLASILRRNPMDKLSLVHEYKTYYEHEWFTGFSNTIQFRHNEILPAGFTNLAFPQSDGTLKNGITISELQLNTRLAYREKFVMGEFERVSLGTTYPVLNFKYTHGLKGFWNSDYEYHKFQVNLRHWFNIGAFGWSEYTIESGYIEGTLPYPLLKLHEGNETFSFDTYAFNTMNYFEFASDRYLSLFYSHHFDGLFLNRIPLMRKLKWREVALVKGLIGDMSEKNYQPLYMPTTMSRLSEPYFEAAVGVENIFKILRFDLFWRLSYMDKPDIQRITPMISLQVYF